jgi:phosphate/sulfate permease
MEQIANLRLRKGASAMIRLECSDSGCPVVRSLKVTVDPVIGSVSVAGFAFPALSCQVWKCMVSVGPILSRIRNTSGLVTSVPAKDRGWAALSPNAICCFRAEETAKCSSGFFSKRVIQTKITAPTNATMMEPIMPPPCQIPNIPKIRPPKTPPRMPRMMTSGDAPKKGMACIDIALQTLEVIILSAHAAIALGTYFGGWRIVHTKGKRITKLKPVGGFCAESAGAITLFGTALAGTPVSTTHTITGAIVGVGAVHRLSAVRWGIARRIVWAWMLTIPSAIVAGAAFAVMHLFHAR